MRRVILIAVSLAAAAALAIPALAADTTIMINQVGTSYSPADTTMNFGAGNFHWKWGTTGSTNLPHNVRQDVKLFRSGSPTASNPTGFTVPASAGSFHYYCEQHGAAAMSGVVRVTPIVDPIDPPEAGDLPFRVRWATSSTQTGRRFQVKYRVDKGSGFGSWTTWKSNTSKKSDVFGIGGSPVNVRSGRTYEFKVRSKRDDDHRSDPSPILTVPVP